MRKGINLWIVFYIFLSLVILFLGGSIFLSSTSGIFQTIFKIPKAWLYSVNLKLSNPFNILGRADYEKLQNENRQILARFVDYDRIKKDNQVLKEQFENGGFNNDNLIASHIIGFLGRHDYPSGLIIDSGEKDGIRTGAGVIIGKNFIGKVVKTSKTYSRIILPTDKQFTIVGKTVSNNTSGVVIGEDDFVLFGNVVITDELNKDDMVVTKGDIDANGIGVPPDIIIGKISTINKAENKPFQNAKIEPVLNYAKLDMVFVVKQLE